MTPAGGTRRAAVRRPLWLLKLGGELLERPEEIKRVAAGIAALARRVRLIVVHGGGRDIDAGLAQAGVEKVQVDGIRVTDARTLDVVVAVLAGTVNTRLVGALRQAGARPVGLTGADADVAVVKTAGPMTSTTGKRVSLGLVGTPEPSGRPLLLSALVSRGYLPVVACIGATRDGRLLNVNADTLAAHVAVSARVDQLVIAGGTAGVLDDEGRTIDRLQAAEALRLIRRGTASAGMIAKLQACRAAVSGGVRRVAIVSGKGNALAALASRLSADTGTEITP